MLPAFAEIAAGVQRLLAPNPSMMTGPGTNTYLIGNTRYAVIDPGPPIVEHVEKILEKTNGCVDWILATHTHPDHSPAVALLAEQTGAQVFGMAPPDGRNQDQTFSPTTELADGDVVESDEFRLEAVHTPGHASNHLCYRLHKLNWLFTGDHVIDGSTVVIDPPDGDMKAYIDSLRKCKDLACKALAPGHGDVIHDADRAIDWIIVHRLEREAKVLAAIESNPGLTTHELVPHVYQDVDEKLYGLAQRSLLAHALKLELDGKTANADGRWHAIS